METAIETKPFHCEYGRHGARMDYDTFQFIIQTLKDKGVEGAVVSHYSDEHGYGFNYTIDDSSYSANLIQLQPTWSKAAIICLQTITAHLHHLGRRGRIKPFTR